MHKESIKKYLKPSTILSRRSTINNAFISALAPFDTYSEEEVRSAILDLGQDPDGELSCIYCPALAATWDHLFNRVVGGKFSGHGHRIRNLVPCCRTCNERKGGKSWRVFLEERAHQDLEARIATIDHFVSRATASIVDHAKLEGLALEELSRFEAIRAEVFQLMKEADLLAVAIRNKVAPQGSTSLAKAVAEHE
ncbi:hypothetical protein [Tianweitania sp.]|uniref:hypothetical protein n=1 Tax=Tianweitania sp. TaxID=2021634 RepID=UPI00289655C6|nr:hypothetical protein [Tianweitania sp.]